MTPRSDCRREAIHIPRVVYHRVFIHTQLECRPDRRKTVDVNSRRSIDIRYLILTGIGGQAGLAEVLEEAV